MDSVVRSYHGSQPNTQHIKHSIAANEENMMDIIGNTNHLDLPVIPWTVKGPSPLEQADVHNIYSQNI